MLGIMACSRISTFVIVTPVNVEDGVETDLMKSLEETYVTAVSHLSLSAIDGGGGGKNQCLVDPNRCLILQAFIIPRTFVEST